MLSNRPTGPAHVVFVATCLGAMASMGGLICVSASPVNAANFTANAKAMLTATTLAQFGLASSTNDYGLDLANPMHKSPVHGAIKSITTTKIGGVTAIMCEVEFQLGEPGIATMQQACPAFLGIRCENVITGVTDSQISKPIIRTTAGQSSLTNCSLGINADPGEYHVSVIVLGTEHPELPYSFVDCKQATVKVIGRPHD